MRTADFDIAAEEIIALRGIPADKLKAYAERAVALNHIDFKRGYLEPLDPSGRAERDRKRRAQINYRARVSGLCSRCGKLPARQGRLHCLVCAWDAIRRRPDKDKRNLVCEVCQLKGHTGSTCDVFTWAKEQGHHGE